MSLRWFIWCNVRIKNLFQTIDSSSSKFKKMNTPKSVVWNLVAFLISIGFALLLIIWWWKGTNGLWDLSDKKEWTYNSNRKNEILRSAFQCNHYNKNDPYIEPDKIPHDAVYSTCKLENVCLSTRGEFLMYQTRDRLHVPEHADVLNTRPWVYTQGRVESGRGYFYPLIVNSDIAVKYDEEGKVRKALHFHDEMNSGCTAVEAFENSCANYSGVQIMDLPLSDSFEIIKEPVYAYKRYASGNVGHNMLENVNMVLNLMLNYNPSGSIDISTILDNHVMFLDDVYDETEPDNWISTYDYPIS